MPLCLECLQITTLKFYAPKEDFEVEEESIKEKKMRK